MSKYITLQPWKFWVEFRDAQTARIHRGQLAVAALVDQSVNIQEMAQQV